MDDVINSVSDALVDVCEFPIYNPTNSITKINHSPDNRVSLAHNNFPYCHRRPLNKACLCERCDIQSQELMFYTCIYMYEQSNEFPMNSMSIANHILSGRYRFRVSVPYPSQHQ